MSNATHIKAQLDYIMVNKKWKCSVKDAKSFNWFNSLDSDKRLVLSKIKVSLMKVKQPECKKRYDWSAFKEDTNLQQRLGTGTVYSARMMMIVTTITMVLKVKKKKQLDISYDTQVCQAGKDLMLAKTSILKILWFQQGTCC